MRMTGGTEGEVVKMEGGLRVQGAEGEPRKTKAEVNGAQDKVSVRKVDPCGVCWKRVMANSVMCVKCGNGSMEDARK